MADALNTKNISAFADNTAPADTDYFLNATGNVIKKNKSVATDRMAEREAGNQFTKHEFDRKICVGKG